MPASFASLYSCRYVRPPGPEWDRSPPRRPEERSSVELGLDIWLSPAFRDWNIEASLPGIDCPLLLIQGRDDEYGTLAQLDAIERRVSGRVQRVELSDCGHSPHRDQPQATLAAIAGFISSLD